MLTGLISPNVLFDRSKPQLFIRVFINQFHRRGEEANLTRFRTIAAKRSRLTNQLSLTHLLHRNLPCSRQARCTMSAVASAMSRAQVGVAI